MERYIICIAQFILRRHRLFLRIVQWLAKCGYWLYILYGIIEWCRPGRLQDKLKRRQTLWYCLFSVIVGSLLSLLTGWCWHRKRPFAAHADIDPLIAHRNNASFPSNHSMNAMAVAITLLRCGNPAGLFFLPFAILIGASRVLCGVHYVTDVVGGFLFGMVSAVLVGCTKKSTDLAQKSNWYYHVGATILKAWYQRKV